MTSAELVAFFRERARGWSPAPLNLKLRTGQRPYAKPRRGYSTPAGLVPSEEYMLQEQIRKGYIREVPYDSKYFISQGFCQVKEGRCFPGTDLPMVRLLVDCRQLNAACVDAPLHHYDSCPTQEDMCTRVPHGSKYFRYYDLSDAFHSCKLTPATSDLVVAQFNGKYYQYLGGAQGIANMAIHWNIHLMDSFDRLAGEHWRDWYTLYVDDVGVHAMTEHQILTRGRVLEAMLTVLDKPFSDKTGATHGSCMDLAGLHFDGDGVRLSDDMFNNLTSCLHEYEVRNARDVGHVVGLLQYCRSAFEWPDDIPRAEFSDLLSQLNTVAALPAKSIPSSWLKVYPPVRDRLLSLLRNSPWAYCDPASIISDASCLVMVTDASDTAVAVSLFRVKVSDASTVTKADLLDASKSQLIAVCYKKLHKSALNWHTFEAELHAIVLGCSKFGNFITTATVKYPPSGVPKLLILSDSTTALSQWSKVSLPDGVLEHLSAKARRFHGWADKVAYTRYWPMCTRHLPGDQNDISHILSHLGEQTRDRHDWFVAAGVPVVACPATVHSYHGPPDPHSAIYLIRQAAQARPLN